jgi:hypothetical protein
VVAADAPFPFRRFRRRTEQDADGTAKDYVFVHGKSVSFSSLIVQGRTRFMLALDAWHRLVMI